jgi:hypothetical protein
MKQTAVEFLIEEIKPFLSMPIEDAYKTILQAKEMEKQQIIDAHGNKQKMNAGISTYKYTLTGEQYYNETYGK